MRSIHFALVLVLIGLLTFPTKSFATSPEEDLRQANVQIDEVVKSVQLGDTKTASEQFKKYTANWISFESGIKEKSEQAYHDIEDNMGQVQFALAQDPVNSESVQKTLQQLKETNTKFINGQFSQTSISDQDASKNNGDVAKLIMLLNQSLDKIDNQDIDGAKLDIEEFRKSWLDVEGVVLTQSATVYKNAESDMVTSYSMLSANPPDVKGAKKTIEEMRDYLSPLVSKTSYTMLDATTILLREGLEALLVVVALMGFLKKSGHSDKSKWIWIGVGSGIGISLVLGILVNFLFSAGTFGHNNFLIAGWTGVFAAVMLSYMSYWLHSKSSILEWNRYIQKKSTKALDTGSLLSIAILAFLAVFREGTETVLFYIGMASSIDLGSLLGGIAIGLTILLITSYLILKVGLKIPMRPFFMVSSILMFYLCFKFTGMGIHGLQLAGFIPATQAPIPTIDFFAIYSTWESFIPQMILLVVAVFVAFLGKIKQKIIQSRMKKQEELNNAI